MEKGERLARILGWFSIGLGLAQIAAPRSVARFIGVSGDRDSQALMRVVGVRELASGVGILAQPRPTGWLWARVAGDGMDLALLSTARASDTAQQNRLTAATAAVVGIALLDLRCSTQLQADTAAPKEHRMSAEDHQNDGGQSFT